jgi:hypothetical protein
LGPLLYTVRGDFDGPSLAILGDWGAEGRGPAGPGRGQPGGEWGVGGGGRGACVGCLLAGWLDAVCWGSWGHATRGMGA